MTRRRVWQRRRLRKLTLTSTPEPRACIEALESEKTIQALRAGSSKSSQLSIAKTERRLLPMPDLNLEVLSRVTGEWKFLLSEPAFRSIQNLKGL